MRAIAIRKGLAAGGLALSLLLSGAGAAGAGLAGAAPWAVTDIVAVQYGDDSACLSWSDARNAGWIEKFNLKPASDIKTSVEKRHGGKVVNFVLCPEGARVVYKLSVFQPNGNVVFVTEPAQ